MAKEVLTLSRHVDECKPLLEGVAACNRFIDCSSLTAGGGGTLLFLAHKVGRCRLTL